MVKLCGWMFQIHRYRQLILACINLLHLKSSIQLTPFGFVCVCVLPRNLGECFVLLLVEPITVKNASPSDKRLWRFLKNVSVAEKS